ncbi:MAG: alpha/beta fold hydrolase [Steroidobacterales bacterium]
MKAGRPNAFLLIHGAWHGGWCWDRVASALRAQGDTVLAPTLPGMGEHEAPPSKDIGLIQHAAAVLQLIDQQRLDDFVLVGHSYAGMVVSAVADQRAQRIRHLVYLDAFVPEHGQSLASLLPADTWAAFEQSAGLSGSEQLLPAPPPALFGLSGELAMSTAPRLRAQPKATFTQPAQLPRGGWAAVRARTYIACDEPASDVFEPFKRRLQQDRAWGYQSMATGHDAMLSAPDELAARLSRIASEAWPRRSDS